MSFDDTLRDSRALSREFVRVLRLSQTLKMRVKINRNRIYFETLGTLTTLSERVEVFFKLWISLSKTLNSLGLSRGFANESLRAICKWLKSQNSQTLKNSPPYEGRLRWLCVNYKSLFVQSNKICKENRTVMFALNDVFTFMYKKHKTKTKGYST